MSVSEAYSMQPKFYRVISAKSYESYYDKPMACKEINLETVHIGAEPVMFYVGYNYDGQKIFQILATAANVEYSNE